MTLFEWLTVIIAGATAVIGLGSLIFVGLQVRQASIETRNAALAAEEERRRQRKRETIEALAATSRYSQELKTSLPWNDRDPEIVKEFLVRAEDDEVAKASVRAYLDYLEMIATGVNADVLDLELLARSSGGRFIAVARNYAPYIELRRKELGTDSLYEELLRLADSIARAKGQPQSKT